MQKDFFSEIVENIFFQILLPKTTPLTVGIMYRPRSQTNFLGIWNMTFEKVDLDKKDVYTLGHFSINMYHNNKYVVRDDNTISLKFLSHDVFLTSWDRNFKEIMLSSRPILFNAPLKVTNSISESCNL